MLTGEAALPFSLLPLFQMGVSSHMKEFALLEQKDAPIGAISLPYQ